MYEELSLFSKFKFEGVVVPDPGLAKYIDLSAIIAPHSSGKHANKFMGKANVSIIERLINNLMRGGERKNGAFTGKKSSAQKAVIDAFDFIEEKTKKNAIQVLVDAITNAAPVEEAIRLVFAGVSVPRAVDTAPQRRVDIALRNIAKATIKASHKNKKPIHECLANEIILASRNDVNSKAVSRKEEIERVARSAR